jgi:hypothetical protein
MDTIRKFGLGTRALGLLLLVGALWTYVSTSRFVARASSAPGIVIAVRATADDEAGEVYLPVVRFTRQGVEETFESPRPGARGSVGRKVEVLFVPGEEPRIRSFATLWFAPFVLTVMGASLGWLGYIMILYARADAQKKPRPQGA